MSPCDASADLDRIVAFLRDIGLGVRASPGVAGFLPGLRVDAGALVYDPDTLVSPGDLLHEAGHLALVPAAQRAATSDEVEVPGVAMGDVEPAAMLWSYAATLEIGLDPAVVFHDAGYRGRAPALLRTYGFGVYPGIAVLTSLGLCDPASFPRMLRWLAP